MRMVELGFLWVSWKVSLLHEKFPVSSAGNCTEETGNYWHITRINIGAKRFPSYETVSTLGNFLFPGKFPNGG